MLNIEQIKEKHGPSRYTIAIPEWGGDVLARRLTAQDYIVLNAARDAGASQEDAFRYMADVVERSLINEDGSPLFDEQSRHVLTESPLLLTRIGTEILERNNLTVEPGAKNSESNPS